MQSNLPDVYLTLGRDRDWALMRIRQADARPANVSLNFGAAATLVYQGNLAAARRYATRGEAALSPDAETRNVREWSNTQLLRAYLDWVEAKPGESLARAHRLAAAIDRVPEELRKTFTRQLIYLYLALGRLKAAQELAEHARVWEESEPYLLAYVLRERGNLDGLREYLTTRWTHDQSSKATADAWRMETADAWRVEFLVPAGMLEEAERDIDRYESRVPSAIVETSFYPSLMGQLELGRGRPRDAVRLLQSWLAAPNRALTLPMYQWPAQKLADALEALGNTAAAIEVLEKVGEHPPPLLVVRHMWLTSKAQLARLYRENGEEAKARAIEARLLKMLAVADADHPLIVELRARP